ncbi:MAG: trimethylamine methyltransferase family protein [Alphaproteobacteria bacterium]|nr:trimethylamine methyltransferase family protein [Alphaproteobacteria bacterium]
MARQARPRRKKSQAIQQVPWRRLKYRTPPVKLISDDEIEAVHDASMRILEEVGMDFLHPEALAILKAAGADVTEGSERVRFDRAFIEEKIKTAPAQFPFHARNPERTVGIGGDELVICAVASAPNASDLDGGRRPGNFVDFENFCRLSQAFNVIQMNGGYPVEPVDVHPSVRHLHCLKSFITLTDKPFHAYSLGRQRNLDALEMTRIARGVPMERFHREPSLMTVINTSSPLRLDTPMIEGVIEMGRAGQIAVITPFTLAGAMAPVTLAGALAQQNAEALAAIAFAQCSTPGAPVVYGGFTSNVDMKSGAPAFGTPEFLNTQIIGGQLARRYDLPYRASNVNASNCVDAQAAYESQMSIWGLVQGHGNIMKHGAGWLEGGLCASFEKMVVDVEMLQMISEFLQPVSFDEASLGLDAVREVGPGGHYFGAAHTIERYETAFYSPMLSDWRNFETWEETGSETATQRANRIYKQMLQDYEAPPLDAAIREELDAFVAKRVEEGGVASD